MLTICMLSQLLVRYGRRGLAVEIKLPLNPISLCLRFLSEMKQGNLRVHEASRNEQLVFSELTGKVAQEIVPVDFTYCSEM